MKNILKSVLESACIEKEQNIYNFKHFYLNIVQCNMLNFLNFFANFLRY